MVKTENLVRYQSRFNTVKINEFRLCKDEPKLPLRKSIVLFLPVTINFQYVKLSRTSH